MQVDRTHMHSRLCSFARPCIFEGSSVFLMMCFLCLCSNSRVWIVGSSVLLLMGLGSSPVPYESSWMCLLVRVRLSVGYLLRSWSCGSLGEFIFSVPDTVKVLSERFVQFTLLPAVCKDPGCPTALPTVAMIRAL